MKSVTLYTGILLDARRALVPIDFISDVKSEMRDYGRAVTEGSPIYNDLGEMVGRYLFLDRPAGSRKLRPIEPYENALRKAKKCIDQLIDAISNNSQTRIEKYRLELQSHIEVADRRIANV